LEGANCCGFALQQAYNEIYAIFLEAIPLRNTIRVDILLISNFSSNIRTELLYGRKKEMTHLF
jgi:hypothetical protein